MTRVQIGTSQITIMQERNYRTIEFVVDWLWKQTLNGGTVNCLAFPPCQVTCQVYIQATYPPARQPRRAA